MIHLRKLAYFFRRAIATVAFGQGAPHSVTLKSRLVATVVVEPSTPRRTAGQRLALCVISAARRLT